MNWTSIFLSAAILMGCHRAYEKTVAPGKSIEVIGAPASIRAFLAEYSQPQDTHENRIILRGRETLTNGDERLRFQIPDPLPYREVGGFIFLVEKHGLTTRIEAPQP